jgi:hypothetical protein
MDGSQEVFTVRVDFETLDLYGRVSAERTVTVGPGYTGRQK